MKKLIFPSLLLIGINAFSQTTEQRIDSAQKIATDILNIIDKPCERCPKLEIKSTVRIDTVVAYFTIADTKNNDVRGLFGYLVRERLFGATIIDNKIVDKITTLSTTPLDYRRKPFPKTILITFTKEYDREPVIW